MATPVFCGILVLGLRLLLAASPTEAVDVCHAQSTCASQGCVPIPTSLEPIWPSVNADIGWNPGGPCGTKWCGALRCPCGNPLGIDVCEGGGGGGSCNCGPGDPEPCEYTPDFLSAHLLGDASAVEEPVQEPPALPLFAPATGAALDPGHADSLARIREFYRDLRSIHVQATVWIRLPERTGTGELEYWADGGRYRLSTTATPSLGLASDIEAAYDLEQYQLLLKNDSVLVLRRQDPRQLPAPFPNVLFLPVAFLGFEDDACYACEPTVVSSADAERWTARAGAARQASGSSGSEVEILIPGTQLAGEPFYYRVLLARRAGFVNGIELVRGEGEVFRRIALTRYKPVPGTRQRFPWHIVVTDFDAEGGLAGEIHYTIKSMEANAPVAAERFRIPMAEAARVIDEDARAILKHPQLGNGSRRRGCGG